MVVAPKEARRRNWFAPGCENTRQPYNLSTEGKQTPPEALKYKTTEMAAETVNTETEQDTTDGILTDIFGNGWYSTDITLRRAEEEVRNYQYKHHGEW